MSETTPDTPAAPRVPEAVGVYGGGRMGAGIAHAFATAGARVIVIESTDDTVVAARGRIDASIEKSQSKGIDVPGTVEVVRDPTLLDQTLLVVEAVPEDLGLKQEILTGIPQYAPAASIGTHSPALSIDEPAAGPPRPQALIGLLFFSPVPVSELVEVVVGTHTEPGLVEVARSEEHTSELQSRGHLVCRLLLEKKKTMADHITIPQKKSSVKIKNCRTMSQHITYHE